GVDDAIPIVLENRADRVGRLGPCPPLAGPAALRERRQNALFVVFQLLADRGHRRFFGRPRRRVPPGRSPTCFSPAGTLARRLSWPPWPWARSCRPRSGLSSRRAGFPPRPRLSPLR